MSTDLQTPGRVGAQAHVLLVEDDEAVARLSERVLKRLGHGVETFMRAEPALERVAKEPDAFDVVITDHRMPGMTGAEFLVRLRRLGIAVPAMMVSGYAEEIDEDLLRRTGVGPVLDKPFTKAEMQARIDGLLSEARARAV